MKRRRHSLLLLLSVLAPVVSALGESIEIHGRVRKPDGRVLAGATVELRPVLPAFEAGVRRLEGLPPVEPVALSHSDETGGFSLRASSPGVFAVTVRAGGFLAMRVTPWVALEDLELPPLVLPRSDPVRIRVRGADGRPRVGFEICAVFEVAALTATSDGYGWSLAPRRAHTDETGTATLAAAGGEILRARPCTATPAEHGEIRTDEDFLTLTLRSVKTELVEIRDARDRPVPDALILHGPAALPAGRTDADGRLHLPRVPGEPRILRILTAGGRAATAVLAESDGTGDPATVTVAEPLVLDGRILGPRRRPLVGALIWSGGAPGSFALSGEDGRYRLTLPAAEGLWIQAEATGHLRRATRPSAVDLAHRRAPTLSLATPARITGKIVDPVGEPIAGARLEALPSDPRRRPFFAPDPADSRATSGTGGRFALAGLRPGASYKLRVTGDGFAAHTVELRAPIEGEERSIPGIVLTPGRPASGRVVDLEDRPVAGVAVRLRDPARPRPRTRGNNSAGVADPGDLRRAVTNRDGRFFLSVTPATRIDVELRKGGFAAFTLRGVDIPPGHGAHDLGTMVLSASAAVSGRVLNREGRGIAVAELRVVSAHESPSARMEQSLRRRQPQAVADGSGRFEIRDLLPGKLFGLWIRADGYNPVWLGGVRAPTEETVVAVLDPALSIAGTVVDEEGAAVENARAELTWRGLLAGSKRRIGVGRPRSHSARTGADGRFEISELRPGLATLEARADGLVTAPPVELEIRVGESVEGLHFVLRRGTVAEGWVTTTDGDPVAGARVMAGKEAAFTDADGVYRLTGVPEGPATLEVSHLDYPPHRRAVEMQAGVNVFELVLPAGVAVAGRVLDPDGGPIEGALVELEAMAAGPRRAYRSRSDSGGDFRLAPVAEGRYRLRASRAGHAETRLPEPVGVEGEPLDGIVIELQTAARIVGHVAGLDFDELGRVSIFALDAADRPHRGRLDYRGRYEIDDLAAGDWLVRASLDGGERQTQVRVSITPEDREVVRDLRFGDGVTLDGSVLYDGQPLTAARVSLIGLDLAVRHTIRSDYRGGFRFEDLEAATYRLELTHEGEHLVHNQRLTLESDRELTLSLDSVRISGRVTAAESGAPVTGAVLVLRHLVELASDEEFVVATGSDEQGFFELPRVPIGRYRLTARKDGFGPHQETLEVRAGLDLEDLEIGLERTGGLDVVVRLASGEVPPFANFLLLAENGALLVRESRRLDAEGRARLASAPPGSWELLVGAPGAAAVRVPVTVPADPVEILLPPAGHLRIRIQPLADSDRVALLQLLGVDSRPLLTIDEAGDLRERWSLPAGRGEVTGVPIGFWILRAISPDGRIWSAPVEIVEGSPVEVLLE